MLNMENSRTARYKNASISMVVTKHGLIYTRGLQTMAHWVKFGLLSHLIWPVKPFYPGAKIFRHNKKLIYLCKIC